MKLIPVAALAALAAGPVAGQPLIFTGIVEGRLGVTTDPFLRNESGSAALAGFTISPSLSRETSLGLTSLNGTYNTERYLKRYGRSENFGATLAHRQRLSAFVTASGQVGYNESNSPLGRTLSDDIENSDPLLLDFFSGRRRTHRLDGNARVDWQVSARDTFNVGVTGNRTTFSGGGVLVAGANDYDQIGVNAGYFRAVTANTSIGINGSATNVDSKFSGSSSSRSASVAVQQKISAYWGLNGDVGVIFQRQAGSLSTSKNLGIHLNICGRYPRDTFCFTAARDSSATGFGALRTITRGSVRVQHTLDEHSNVSLTADYQQTRGAGNLTLENIDAASGRVDYSRQLTRRLSLGASARYQRRTGGFVRAADSKGATVNLRLRIGRVA